jgi:nucleotide-binding universal stress UspA family protein
MIGKLLFAVDFSPYTEKLVACAGELGAAGLRDVILLYVLESKKHAEIGDDLNPAHEAELEQAQEHLDKLGGEMEAQGLKVTKALKTGDPAQEIIQAARDEDVDIIFMGAKGKGPLDRAILGSVSNKVLKSADRSVMIQQCRVVKGEGGYSCENVCELLFSNILVANDFSHYSETVKPLIVDLASTFCTPMTMLHVVEGKSDMGYQVVDKHKKEEAMEEMEKLQQAGYELGDYCESVKYDVVNGSVPSAILAYADDIDASLIVLGAFGKRGIIDTLLGSAAEKVVNKSERPVLVLKSGSSE